MAYDPRWRTTTYLAYRPFKNSHQHTIYLAGQQRMQESLPQRAPEGEALPQYFDLLSDTDKSEYLSLRVAFNADSLRRNRGKRIETFDGILEMIRQFAEKGDENDWKRCLVCGVCWMDRAIAINTRQLRLLIAKCKSSINGSLQKMGFSTNPSHSESWKILFSRIPLLKDNFTEIRQWTIRYRMRPMQMDGVKQMAWMAIPVQTVMTPQNHSLFRTQSGPAVSDAKPGPSVPRYPLKVRAKMGDFGEESRVNC